MNQKTLEAMSACSASFLRFNFDAFTCYTAAKLFVDAYEREKHEQRRAVPDPAQRAFPPDWGDDKQKAYHQLASAVFEGGDFVKIQAAAKSFVEICKREEREKKPKPDRAWSPAKHQAYNILLDDFLTYAHYDEIVADARRLAAVCEREEHEQRHESQNNPYERHIEKPKAYDRLGVESCTGVNVNELQEAVKSSAQACKPEGRHKSQADTTGWSYAKSTAYERLQLLCNEKDNWSHNQNVICNAARRLAAACEREELEYPKNGEVYRDIFGNRYVVISVHGSFSDVESGSNPFVALMKMGTTALVTVGLKDFFYPTFKKE